jgi:hypothetical protein
VTDSCSTSSPPGDLIDEMLAWVIESAARHRRLSGQPAGDSPEEFFEAAEVAKQLRIKKRTVAELAKRGNLPPGDELGGLRRWRWPEVVLWIQARRGQPRQEGVGRGRWDRNAKRVAAK